MIPIHKIAVGQSIKGFYLCIYKITKTTRFGDSFLDITLQDRTGIIRGKLWKNTRYFSSQFKEGDEVAVKGIGIDYKNIKEIKIDFINKIEEKTYKDYGYSNDLLIPKIFKSTDKLFDIISIFIESLRGDYKVIIKRIYTSNRGVLLKLPAIDYPIEGAYLYHLSNVLSLSKKIDRNKLDYNKTIAGILIRYIGIIHYFSKTNHMIASKRGKKIGIEILGLDILNLTLVNFKRKFSLEVVDFLKSVIMFKNKDIDEIKYIDYLFKIDRLRNKYID